MLRLDRHCRGRHGGGDVCVAVAVASDPAAKAEESRRARRPTPRVCWTQGTIQRPVDLRHCEKKSLVEHRHDSADLIEGLDLRGAQLPGPPERVDLLDQSPPGVDAFTFRARRVVKPVELVADSTDRGHHSAPASLGRVGCEDRVHLEVGKHLLQASRAVA